MSDLSDRIESTRTGLEKLIARIPGFGGYMNKEDRREADKMLRDSTARQLNEQRRRLADIQTELMRNGKLEYLDEIETANRRLNTAVDKLRTASYGYAGLFDAVKIREAELDRLYAYDTSLLDRVDHIEAAINALDTSARGGQAAPSPAMPSADAPVAPDAPATAAFPASAATLDQNLRNLNDLLRDLVNAIEQRRDVLMSGQ